MESSSNTTTLEHLNGLTAIQLAALYEKKYGFPATHQDYNVLVAALYYGVRIKHLTEDQIEKIKYATKR